MYDEAVYRTAPATPGLLITAQTANIAKYTHTLLLDIFHTLHTIHQQQAAHTTHNAFTLSHLESAE